MLRAPPSRDREQPAQAVPGPPPARGLSARRLPKPWLLGSAGGVALLVVIGLLSFGPIVRSRIAKEAARRRVDVTVGSVRPGFFAVNLKDVHVRLQNVQGVEVRVE